ncbi:hypothetical protein [Flavobacterium psychrophilum]|uniref:hypothetical protein n=1 Tax=Flavobacterium psychrophilum TaxID=96345 RepID=UPI001D07234A|nr:hypothetical protein [Flavobacterium psychrophilum]MCB6089499.1 hypothetical protein [Flavobacterium psychrophilum]
MDNNFVLNVIWKEEKIVKIDDENLSKKESEKFYYNTEKSTAEKLIFSKKNVGKEIKQNYFYAVIILVLAIVLMSLWEKFGPTGDFAIKIAGIIIIGGFLSFLGLIISPLITYKNIYFEIDEFGQERIRKQNVIGSISTILNLKNIKEIKLINDKLNSYFLISEESDEKISEKSIIFIIERVNKKQIIETEKMLLDFIEKEIKVSEIESGNM